MPISLGFRQYSIFRFRSSSALVLSSILMYTKLTSVNVLHPFCPSFLSTFTQGKFPGEMVHEVKTQHFFGGYPWIFMDQWKSMKVYGYPRKKCCVLTSWTFMGVHEVPQISMDFHGPFRLGCSAACSFVLNCVMWSRLRSTAFSHSKVCLLLTSLFTKRQGYLPCITFQNKEDIRHRMMGVVPSVWSPFNIMLLVYSSKV